MKKSIVIFFILLISAFFLIYVSGCKKSGSVPKFVSYFPDTSIKSGGGVPSNIPVKYVEDLDSALVPTLGKTTFISSWDIDAPPVQNQNDVKNRKLYGSCVGWAVGYGMLSFLYHKLEQKSVYDVYGDLFSPLYIWNQLNNGQNQGIGVAEALQLLVDQGCCKWEYMPGNNYSFTNQPSNAAILNAANFKLDTFRQFETVNINLIKHYLNKNYVFPILVSIDEGFETGTNGSTFEKQGDGRLVWKNKSNSIVDQHAMVICGYDDDIHALKVLNSWGVDWGNHGFVWVDYDFLSQVIVFDGLQGKPEIYMPFLSAPTSTLHIGDSYQGGLIAYFLQPGDAGYNPSVQHGLIAAPNDQSTAITWSNGTFTTTGATGTAIGTGAANTNAIIASQGNGNYAASICHSLSLGGYNDWYLPSRDELDQMSYIATYINLFTSFNYWSSTEVDNSDAVILGYSSGYGYYKSFNCRVRAVRSF